MSCATDFLSAWAKAAGRAVLFLCGQPVASGGRHVWPPPGVLEAEVGWKPSAHRGGHTRLRCFSLFLSPLPLQGHLLDEMNGLPTRSPPIPLLGQRARLREARAAPRVSSKGDWMLKQLVCSGPEL